MWFKTRLPFILAFILAPFALNWPVIAKTLPQQGTTFEIKEQSLLQVIEEKLRVLGDSGKLQGHQKEIQARVAKSIERPRAVEGIVKATQFRSRYYDPSLIMDEDIKDHKGNLIVKGGTKVNPLDYHSFGKPLLLINGDDVSQVKWALGGQGKIVLLKGAPLALAKMHGQHFYFDQGGILAARFSIRKIPARISQKGKFLLIEEIALNVEGRPPVEGRLPGDSR